MRISIATTLLADASLALAPHSGLALNGQSIVDEAEFFRAAVATFYHRGVAGVTLTFNVERTFGTLRKAEAFVLTHFGAIPKEGLLTCVCGESGDTETIYLRNCVVEAAPIPGYRGLSVGVQYRIRGGAFETDVPAEEIPGAPEGGEAFVVLRRGKVSIAAAATSVAVTFTSPLAAVPVVACNISRPTGGDVLRATLREDSITASGFTVDLSAAAPDANSKLHYVAIE